MTKFYGLIVLRFNGIFAQADVDRYMKTLNDTGEIPGLFLPKWILYACLAAGVIAYLFGSINTSVFWSKVRYHDDIRNHGSGNAGMTNMFRVYGKSAGIITIVGDFLKTVIPVFVTLVLLGETAAYFAGLCCVVGHAYPVFCNFKGGKGVIATATTVLVIEPVLFVVLFAVFLIVFLFTKYVSLGSIFASLIYPVFMPQVHKLMYGAGSNETLSIAMLICLATGLFILYRHKANIRRLLDHEENRFDFKKKNKEKSEIDEK